MKRRTKIIITASVSIFVLTLSYWQPSKQVDIDTEATLSGADYFFREVKLKQYEQDGSLASQLTAEKMVHFREKNRSTFEAPAILFSSQSSSAWQLTSAKGYLEHNTNQLKLEREVRIFPLENANSSLIATQNLDINLEQKIAKTDTPVSIQTDSTKTHAVGMVADFNMEQIKLVSNVVTQGARDENE